MTPRVSVIMPVRNCRPFVMDAVNSILNQHFADFEFLIVDDGSTDGTYELLFDEVADARVHIFRGQENLGLPARLNQLIEMSRGEFIARMDGDDISYPDRLERQLAYLQTNVEVTLVACSMAVIDAHNQLIGMNRFRGEDHATITATPWRGFHMNHATWVAPRAFFDRWAYDPDAAPSEDDELLLRAYRSERFACLPDVLYAYRVDGLSVGRIIRARLQFLRSVLRSARRTRSAAFLLAVPDQIAKASVDAVAILSGLERSVLRHRFGDFSPADREKWLKIVDSLGESV